MAIESTAGIALLVARIAFGGVLAFTGLNHFMTTEQMVGYADAKGVPLPTVSVLGSGAMLVLGGLGIALGAFAAVSAAAIAAFLLVATPMMHDFWNVPEAEQQSEMTQFLKNAALFGGAIAFAVLALETWPYAIGVGLI
ncbi:DoxX family protein [Natribaculum luteum]|uniref:DoxX family protein n=1 Tax=Natribaculum luteum TaxID=1586232 RepID=A0ABD5P0X9_9EURY|nr:DoxX family protein [Natribaculum luteum]